MKSAILYIVLLLGIMELNAQITIQNPNYTIQAPRAPTLSEMRQAEQQRVQQQNNAIIQADMMQYEQRQQQAKGIIDEATREFQTVSYEFPNNSHFHTTKYFREALSEITEMLEGKKELSLKKAVFLTENAYLENSRNYEWFCSDLNTNVDLIQYFMKKEGLPIDDDISKKYMLQRFLADTLTMKDDKGNHQLTHLPF
jgi:antitoxin component HigA of HigAB toxin-antitoxin module